MKSPAKTDWRERLAKPPPAEQVKAREVIKKYIKLRQQRIFTADGDRLHKRPVERVRLFSVVYPRRRIVDRAV
jgi:hypothetical protein